MRVRELSHLTASQVRPMQMAAGDVEHWQDLSRIGICFDAADIDRMNHYLGNVAEAGIAMDALVPPVTTPSIGTPIQFLQEWLPGFVNILTAARKIDSLVGITTQGRWEDEEIVQGVMEHSGQARPYGDYTNIPLSSWNVNFARRTIVRFEEGMQVGKLEEARAAAMRVNSPEAKREAAALALEIIRNRIGFIGYNNGVNRTYGLLNDPELPAYVNLPNGAGGFSQWSTKTYLEILADIRSAVSALRLQSVDTVDPHQTPLVLALSLDAFDYLSVTNELGSSSVMDWIKKTYPNMRVESVPEFVAANGGDSVFYLYAESVSDNSTDDGRTFVQVVPTKFITLGVEPRAKNYTEDYSNGTAGVLTKRPFAVVRRSGC